MSKSLIGLLSLGIIGGGVGLWYLFQREPVVKNFPTENVGPILVYGDSLAEGVGATSGHDLSSLIERATDVSTLNYGVSGNTTRDGMARLKPALDENPRLVIVILGGNDFLQKVPRAETFANLETIIRAFQNQGAIVVLVGVRSGIIGGGSDDAFEALAEKTGAAYVTDILDSVFGNNQLMSDAIHPNDQGYATIGKRLVPLVADLLNKK